MESQHENVLVSDDGSLRSYEPLVLYSRSCTVLYTDAMSDSLVLFHMCTGSEFGSALFSLDFPFDKKFNEKSC